MASLYDFVDKMVTEHGVAELRDRRFASAPRRLIEVAHPSFREALEREAREIGYL